MKNHVQAGVNLTLPAPYDVLSGGVVVIGNIFGVAAGDALSGADVDVVTGPEVFELPKVSALAINVGDKVYFDSATKLVNKTASGNTYIGVAVTAAANPSGTVHVRLNPSF
jgi:predicted RecA/RadA family phage recombinase